MSFTAGARWLDRAAAEDALDPALHDMYADYFDQWAQRTKDRAIARRARAEALIARRLRG